MSRFKIKSVIFPVLACAFAAPCMNGLVSGSPVCYPQAVVQIGQTVNQKLHALNTEAGRVAAARLAESNLDDNYRIAAGYYSRGQWDESAAAFADFVQRYPNSEQAGSAYFFLGESLLQQEKYTAAYTAYQTFLLRTPDHLFAPRATFRMGESSYRTGNLQSSLRMLEVFVQSNPQDDLNEYALPYLGEIRLKRNEPQLAQRAYEAALRLYPTSRLSNECRFGLAKSFQLQGANQQALRFYQFILEQPDTYLAGEAQMQTGIILFAENDWEAAQQHLSSALSQCHTNQTIAECSYWLARTYVADHDFERAFEIFESVIGSDVNSALSSAIYFDGAVAATKIGENELAQQWLTEMLDADPKHESGASALHLLIRLSQEEGSATKTADLIQQFVSDYPNSRLKPDLLESSGRTLYANQKYGQSLAVFQQLLSEDLHAYDRDEGADRDNWHYLVGLNQLGMQEFSAAETAFKRISLTGQGNELQPLVEIGLATAQFNLKHFADAIPNYRSYLQHAATGPEELRARTELTVALAETGRWKEVMGAFGVLSFHHANEKIVLETAEYLAKKAVAENNQTQAAHWYEVMAEHGNPLDVVARGLSALAWQKMDAGETEAAMVVFQRILTDCPDSEFACESAMARAKYLDDQKDFPRSAQMYGLVLRRFGDNEMAQVAMLRRAHALHEMGHPNELLEAKTMLTQYLQLPSTVPSRDEALYQLAWVNRDLDLIDDSLENFQDLLDQFPDSKYWADAAYRIAQSRVRQKQMELAKPLITELILREDIPVEVLSRVLYLQGEIASQDGQWESVSLSMKQLLSRADDPRLTTKATYWLAEAMYRQQQHATASELFETLQTNSMVASKLKPWVCLRAAQCLIQLEKWESAAQIAENGKTDFPNFSADYEFDFVRARAMEASGKLTDCRKLYQSVIDSKRGGDTETAAIAQWRIGETFFHQEKYAEAIEAYYRVDSLFSYQQWRAAALLQAGKCQEHLNNWKHALKLYQQLIEKFPSTQYATTAQQRIERVALLVNVQTETETSKKR